jgi:transcriptional/translational regulatory protein YebC/TACO1
MSIAKTDNRQRTGSEIRYIYEKNGGSLAGPGSTSYLFEKSANGEVAVKVPMPISDQSTKAQIENLTKILEDHPDIEFVYTNASFN